MKMKMKIDTPYKELRLSLRNLIKNLNKQYILLFKDSRKSDRYRLNTITKFYIKIYQHYKILNYLKKK